MIPVSGRSFVTPAVMINACSRRLAAHPAASRRLLRPRQSHRNAAAAPEEQRIAHEDKNRSEQAELLGNRRKDEVRMHLGNKMRMSLRKSRSPNAACADGKE